MISASDPPAYHDPKDSTTTILCYCLVVGPTEEEYPVPATAVASRDEKE